MTATTPRTYPHKRPDCPFPGCTGGCHVCDTVRRQRINAPLYEAAERVLARPDLDADTKLLAEYVRERTRPQWDEKKKRWLP